MAAIKAMNHLFCPGQQKSDSINVPADFFREKVGRLHVEANKVGNIRFYRTLSTEIGACCKFSDCVVNARKTNF